MPSPPLLAESHRISMIFLLSSACCSSLRWKKGEEENRQEEGEEINHMDGHDDGREVRTRLKLEPNVSSVDEMRTRNKIVRAHDAHSQ